MKFKVGDRVAVYSGGNRFTGTIEVVYGPNRRVKVNIDESAPYTLAMPNKILHEKQCRRFVKKKCREFWINVYPSRVGAISNVMAYPTKEEADNHAGFNRLGCIHVREVRKK